MYNGDELTDFDARGRTAPKSKEKGDGIGVIFDGDDTLWMTEQLYDDARAEAGHVLSVVGIDVSKWEDLERGIDVTNVATMGYSLERFPESCVQAYKEICRLDGVMFNANVAEKVRTVARSVFYRHAPLASGAEETLRRLRASGSRLALLTKGEPSIQKRRIQQSGLETFFHSIQIVQEKTPAVFQSIVKALDVGADSVWMVGNSIRSDILPALAAGLRAIWIDAHVWEYERAHDHLLDDRVKVLLRLADIPDLIQA